MATTEEVGRGIVEASRFLQKAHKQLAEFIALLDRSMKLNGWVARKSGDIDGHLGNELANPRTWLLQTASRTYARAEASPVGLSILFCLEWTKLEQAMVYVTATRFEQSMTADEVWARWKSGLEYLDFAVVRDVSKPLELPSDVREEWSGALAATTFGVPLCEMTETTLEARLVQPALAMAVAVKG